MKIDRLNSGMILVTMEREDMRAYRLDFEQDADSESVLRGLSRLILRVREECGLGRRGRSYLVEALPGRDGCLLIISVRAVKRRRIYRIKRDVTRTVCIFDDADALLDWMNAAALRGRYTVRMYRGQYVLVPLLPLNAAEEAQLSGYGRLVKADAVSTARILEFGEVVLSS